MFIPDGAKCDIMRLQQMFGSKVVTGVQDPSYPVYVDTSVMLGQTGKQNEETGQYENIVYMPCNPSNGFFPEVEKFPRADIIYICSPK
jgi:LL-diaminopimelate aminotransferase